MPTALRVDGFRFYFFSNEGTEPLHMHVVSGSDRAKFWLSPITLESSKGFNASTLNKLHTIIEENETLLLEKWNEHFNFNRCDVRATSVVIGADDFTVQLEDGRTISIPYAWSPRLIRATAEQRRDFEIIADGIGISWPQVDEDLSVAGLLAGNPIK